jgi:DNA primase
MAAQLSQSTKDQIRAASDIVDVIGAALPLKRAGANFVTLCPFHKEKTPSFHVNPHRQIYHCFGCGKGGDVFTWVQEYEHLSFMEAVRRLAERARIPLEFDQPPGQEQTRFLKESLLQIHEQITQRWQAALANDAAGQGARDYLRQRAVPDEAVKLFRLGCAPEAWDDTVNWARSKGHDLALVEQGGLVLRHEPSGRHYDRFRGRLMFPICDEQGRVIAFSGRVLAGDEKTAKYVNSPETPIFTKGKVFYGLDKTKRAILDAGFAVVCEGQLDLIACYMAGVRNVVAPQGTAFTPEHARILGRYVKEVVLCFDADEAGQNAAVRALDSLLAAGFAIRVASVPRPHDPDSFIKAQGHEAFQKLIAGAPSFFDFYLDRLSSLHDAGSDKGRLAIAKAMAEAVLKTGSAVMADTYAQKTAQRLGVSADSMRAEFRKASRPASLERAAPAPTAEPEETLPAPPEREVWLLRYLLAGEELLPWACQHVDPQWVMHPTARRLVAAVLVSAAQHTWQGVPGLLDQFDDAAARSLLTEAVAASFPVDKLEQKLAETVLRLRDEAIKRELAALSLRLQQPQSEGDAAAILRRQEALRQLRRQPLQVRDCDGLDSLANQ